MSESKHPDLEEGMVKRMAELQPQVELDSRGTITEVTLIDPSARPTKGVVTDCPTEWRSPSKGTDKREATSIGHVAEGEALDLGSFWEMLRLAGYEAW